MTKWIKTAHRVPETNRDVLMLLNKTYLTVGYYSHAEKQWVADSKRFAPRNQDVSHWAERPHDP